MKSVSKGAVVVAVLACLGLGVGVSAKPLFLRSGGGGAGPPPTTPPPPPPPSGGSTLACSADDTNICARVQNGQTFVTWKDMASGATGNNYRYKIVRSLSPITSSNYTSLSPFAIEILNNSAQLYGGTLTGTPINLNATNRQDPQWQMVRLSDLGTPLDYGSGIQVHTATANQDAYYAVVAVQCATAGCPAGATGGTDIYLGSVGPMTETVATPKPIKVADSSRATYGKIDVPVNNIPVVFTAHQSGGTGGIVGGNAYGDLWEWFLTPAEGWQDGRQTNAQIALDKAQNWSQTVLLVSARDAVWNPLGTGGIETLWYGLGMTPLSSVGPANRKYAGTCKSVARTMNWVQTQYSVDPNQLHWQGASMGAWGAASCGIKMSSPRLSAIWAQNPVWRPYTLSAGYWPGLTWSSTWPFAASLGSGANTLGTVASTVLTDTGAVWGGTGGTADIPTYLAQNPGDDIPVAIWVNQPKDGYAAWADNLTAVSALQTARRGHAFAWTIGTNPHNTGGVQGGLIICDGPGKDATICYSKSDFKLNAPYPAFSNSSIDDNMGTGVDQANGYPDGDFSGCINCGFSWNFSSDTPSVLAFTVDNAWMNRLPNPPATTTLTGDISSSGGGTVNVADGSVFRPIGEGNFFIVNNSELIQITSVSGNQVTYTTRGVYGTPVAGHSNGETIRQAFFKPTGPNAGPFSTMTVDITPRRMQSFKKATGATVTCDVTPDGNSTVQKTGNVVGSNGVFTITGITINATGPTSITCS